jgi:uncharacterized protein YukE
MNDSSWPGLGFDPAKGDLHTIESLAYDVKTVGDELGELHELLTRVGQSNGVWEGEAAEKFRGKLGELPKYLQQGHESMQACSQALRTWHTRLASFQNNAKGLEADAVEARAKLDQRNAEIDRVNAEIRSVMNTQISEARAKQIGDEADAAKSAADSAAGELQRIIDEAERLRNDWQQRSEDAERAIREASQNRPPDISVWSKIGKGLSDAWEGFKDFLVDNADLFSTISSALAVAALAVNAIPVVGQVASAILGAGAVVTAGAAMAGHWMGRARGNGTPIWKIALDGVGLIPGGGGLAKGVMAGAKAAKGAKLATGVVQGGKTMMNQLKNPATTKLIRYGLSKFGKDVAPEVITGTVKGASAVNGAIHQIFGGDDKGSDTGGGTAQRHQDVQTMPYPATGDKFHQTLAA